MKFSEFLDKYPEVKVATQQDNERILTFFDSTPMKGDGLVLRYERKPNFFQFLHYQSDKAIVFYAEKEGEIMGVGTLVFRPGRVNGEDTHVGYLGDLRVKFDKRLALLWRKFYGDLLKSLPDIEDLHNCRYLLTAIIDENKRAIKALVDNPKLPYNYLKKAPYEMVNILMKLPLLGSKIRKDIEIAPGDLNQKKEIEDFLNKTHAHKSFGFCFNEFHNELDYRLKHWDHFNMNDFLVVRREGKIVAVTALWSPSPAKKIVVEKIPSTQKYLLTALSLFTKVPKENQELKVLYLTFLTISPDLDQTEREEVFHDLVAHIFEAKLCQDYHMLAYTEFPTQFPLKKGLSGFVSFETPMTLYQVLDKSYLDWELHDGFPPGFEMSLV